MKNLFLLFIVLHLIACDKVLPGSEYLSYPEDSWVVLDEGKEGALRNYIDLKSLEKRDNSVFFKTYAPLKRIRSYKDYKGINMIMSYDCKQKDLKLYSANFYTISNNIKIIKEPSSDKQNFPVTVHIDKSTKFNRKAFEMICNNKEKQ